MSGPGSGSCLASGPGSVSCLASGPGRGSCMAPGPGGGSRLSTILSQCEPGSLILNQKIHRLNIEQKIGEKKVTSETIFPLFTNFYKYRPK